MADTYSQIIIQLVFAVEGRQSLISPEHQEELNKYVTGIVRNKRSKMLAVNGIPDHIHILIGLNPAQAISGLVRDIKADSNEWINSKGWVRGRFSWQEGYGAFSYSRSQLDRVVRYVMNQREHHSKRTFKDEYLTLLRKFDIAFKDEYLFEWT
ncbi:MAG TPA: IS200/IS605 family transposase [Blastocatellia bacterium]|nr:IS200/IS605 family transposase [Blastocatellia bacterium]